MDLTKENLEKLFHNILLGRHKSLLIFSIDLMSCELDYDFFSLKEYAQLIIEAKTENNLRYPYNLIFEKVYNQQVEEPESLGVFVTVISRQYTTYQYLLNPSKNEFADSVLESVAEHYCPSNITN